MSGIDILLVEDDPRLAELTSRYLKQNGLTVTVESNGATVSRMSKKAHRVSFARKISRTFTMSICSLLLPAMGH